MELRKPAEGGGCGDPRRTGNRIRDHSRKLCGRTFGDRNRESGRYRSHRRHAGGGLGDRNEIQEGAAKILPGSAWSHSGEHRRGTPMGTRRDDGAGCLVLAYETDIKRRNYSHGKERVTVYTEDSLLTLIRQMRGEARERRSLDERITKDIWKLGVIGE